MMLNADINRQFEFRQQQWINYGNDFKAANDKGNHPRQSQRGPKSRARPCSRSTRTATAAYFLSKILASWKREARIFFIPSMTALRMIARGIVDPT